MNILLIGGSKSGKSHLAQDITLKLADGGPAYYWAAMEPVDAEDNARIEAHLADRAGFGFITIERGRDILSAPEVCGGALLTSAVLFDSITALLANEMFKADGACDSGAACRCACELLKLSSESGHMVCVCDDVFRDGTVYDQTTEQYRRGLAHICRRLAAEFDSVYEITAGIIKVIKGHGPEGVLPSRKQETRCI